MVGLATRASNNHISRSVFGVRETQVILGNNMEKNADEGKLNLHRCCREHFGPLTVQLIFEDRHRGKSENFEGQDEVGS